MKRTLSIPLTVALVVLLAGLGGCVPKAEHERALAANRRMADELRTAQAQMELFNTDKADLVAQLNQASLALTAKDGQIDSLSRETALLKGSLDEMRERIARLGQMDQPPIIDIRLPQRVHQALQMFAQANPELVEYLPAYGMLKFKSDLTFEKGSDTVRSEAAEAITKFVEIVNTDAAMDFHVYVAGHTDDIPILKPDTKRRHPTNWYLSAHRAVAVQQQLATAGLAPARIGVMGFGEFHPIAPNAANHGGNRLNRRVEIWIVPPGRFLTAAAAAAEEAPAE